ncbi:hypothetical protein FVE85_4987 [Porphyridium purpureum]|uniref:Uncharacterized protein n=1 Tax=Porphyridium purpureum TaxID=35688 RepID=A0A5J4YSG3_PORPP|nr:hypothetical protein FVE85_4987 [Porphyridium purpureum]|eukprot:POR4948..scf236_6
MGFGKPDWNKIHKHDVRNRKKSARAQKRRAERGLAEKKSAAVGMEVDVAPPALVEERALAAVAKKLAFRKPRGLSGKKERKVRQAARLQGAATAAERASKAKKPKPKRGAMEVD